MEGDAFSYAPNRALLEKSLKLAEETKALVAEYQAQDEALSQREKTLREQLKDIKSQKKWLHGMLEEAESSLEHIEENVHYLKCALSPMRTMPPEILLLIFEYVILHGENYIIEGFQTWTLIDDFPTPVLLGSVCSRWYHIVKQNTKLWNSILIRTGALPEWVGEDDEENNNAHFHNIRHWIASGRQENQSLFINDYDPLAISSIYATLKPTGPSWKAIIIDVKVDHGSMSWDIEKIRAEQVIVCLPKERPHTMNQLLPLLRQASHLIIMGALPPWGDMPWVALRKLELTPFASDDPGSVIFGAYALRTIFDAALHLETLSLNFHVAHQTPDDYVANHQEKLGHGALKFLGFPLHHLEEDGRLFGVQIDAPLLQHVTLFSYNGARLSENPSKVETWQGVTSVALYEIIDDEVLPTVQFLRCLPEVISIDVQGRNVEALFTLMTGFYAHIPPKYATIPLPKLTEVTMRGADIKGKTLIEMLEMRLAQLESGLNWISAIEYVTLYGADNVTLDEWKRVNTLLENGRVVTIPDAAAM